LLKELITWTEKENKNMAAKNANQRWTDEHEARLRKFVRQNTPTRVLGIKLGRTPQAIYNKASELGISLGPWNQRPYGTKK